MRESLLSDIIEIIPSRPTLESFTLGYMFLRDIHRCTYVCIIVLYAKNAYDQEEQALLHRSLYNVGYFFEEERSRENALRFSSFFFSFFFFSPLNRYVSTFRLNRSFEISRPITITINYNGTITMIIVRSFRFVSSMVGIITIG